MTNRFGFVSELRHEFKQLICFSITHFLILSQLLSLIERFGNKKIGFYCWKLFIFNYFRVYEVSFKEFLSSLKY